MEIGDLWDNIRRIELIEIDRLIVEPNGFSDLEKIELTQLKEIKKLYLANYSDNKDLYNLVVTTLKQNINGRYRGEVISAISLVNFRYWKQIEPIRKELLRHAKEMCGTDEEKPLYKLGTLKIEQSFLWDAIKTYSNILPMEEANELVYFLDDVRLGTTKKVTLESIQNFFGFCPPDESCRKSISSLCSRVDELSQRYCNKEFLDESTENYILGYYAVSTSMLLGNENSIINFRYFLDNKKGVSQFIKRQLTHFSTQYKVIPPGTKESIPGIEYINQALELIPKNGLKPNI